ncbi:MAG: MBL fold metallo-hydrolase [Methanoregula sp.]|nr:MBL fold metallo-hydrolase [Methanoregula sp.]
MAGNDQLTSLSWQPLPEAAGAELYLLIRKIDTISSNSYLIATADALILIDPGGLPEQVDQLSRIITECREKNDRPVFVFLTHAHTDHFIGVQASPAFAHPDAAIFSVQETGAAALERGDGGITQATLLNFSLVPMTIALPLLTRERRQYPRVPVQLAFPNGAEVTITREPAGDGPSALDRETIRFGPGPGFEIYHTPGHSPDSICLRMGSLLFCGDIVFAANPGVAGQVGWSQECLIRSLNGVEALLSSGRIETVCPGHGRVIAAADALRMFAGVRKEALALSNIAELNPDRVAQTAAFAEDSMEQINELFTIMAGRLYYVSWVMDELGESDLAEKMTTLIRGDTVDELMEAFRDFSLEHHRGENNSINLALKAGQVIGKLQRSFDRDELSRIIDPSFVQRAGRLLSDYITMLRGFTPPTEITVQDIRTLTDAMVSGLSIPSCSDDDLLSSPDDDDVFASLLLARIGARPLLEDIEVSVNAGDAQFSGLIDRDVFGDLLMYILEDLVGTMTNRIEIDLKNAGLEILITVSGAVPASNTPGQRKTKRFLPGLCKRAGGRLVQREDGGMLRFEIAVEAAS